MKSFDGGVTPFDDMIDILFAAWFREYCLVNSSNAEDFREPLKKSFTEGWLLCEKFYEKP